MVNFFFLEIGIGKGIALLLQEMREFHCASHFLVLTIKIVVLTCNTLVYGQPGTGRRPVDWCKT